MRYAIKDIAGTFKEARERKGLSQRALSMRSGVHQYQISKFENGIIDLRLSSLVELARALDLELTLVPRKSLSAVNSIIRSTESLGGGAHGGKSELTRWLNLVNGLVDERPQTKEYAQIQRSLRDLAHFRLSKVESDEHWSRYKKLFADLERKQDAKSAQRVLVNLQNLRNRLAHATDISASTDTVKPAYSLDEDDDG